MADVLEAFSNINRVRIIACLGKKEKNVSSLIKNCKISQSALSQHLMKLKDAGILVCRKEGREQYYSVSDKDIAKLAYKLYRLINKYNKNK